MTMSEQLRKVAFKMTSQAPTTVEVTDVSGKTWRLNCVLAVVDVRQRVGATTTEGHPLFEIKSGIVCNVEGEAEL
jgi:hypothetical protein